MDPLLDSLPCGFAAVADDGTLLDVNTTLAVTLGYARAELRGWHVQKIFPAGGRIFYQTHVYPLLKMHGVAEEIYLPLTTRDGRILPMLLHAARRQRDGAFVTHAVFLPMIQRNQYEEQLLQARRLAEEANAAKSKFLSMMSHDLRTPLTAVTGNASLIAAGVHGPVSDEQKDALDRIGRAARDLLRMITDILSFARVDAGRVEVQVRDVPLAAAVQRAESLLRIRFEEEGLEFTTECNGPIVRADPERLQQIVLNLLTNAIKFTPRGGSVSLSCRVDDGRAAVRVADTGIGIAADQLERVFEPFVQLEVQSSDRGVGLGLAISRELARAMGGDLNAASTPGQGSVFTLELPAR